MTNEESMNPQCTCLGCGGHHPKFKEAYGFWYCERCVTNPEKAEFFSKAFGTSIELFKRWQEEYCAMARFNQRIDGMMGG